MAIATTINLSSLDGNNGFRLGGAESRNFGNVSSVSAGDVNGDGFSDVIVGTFSANSSAGASYVVFGKAAGFDAAMNLIFRADRQVMPGMSMAALMAFITPIRRMMRRCWGRI